MQHSIGHHCFTPELVLVVDMLDEMLAGPFDGS